MSDDDKTFEVFTGDDIDPFGNVDVRFQQYRHGSLIFVGTLPDGRNIKVAINATGAEDFEAGEVLSVYHLSPDEVTVWRSR